MKRSSVFHKTIISTVFLMTFAPLSTMAQDNYPAQNPGNQQVISYQSYTGLAELITMICDDAIYKFQGFFGPSVIEVTPFKTLGQFQEYKISALGVSLADQMLAMVNNDTIINAENIPEGSGKEYQQKLRGVIQEVDGYMRIHISAANIHGERMSYTTTVEMSEPIYRAMHTYL